MAKLTVKDVDLKGKVLVRDDFNVPIKDGVITNDNRIMLPFQLSSPFLNKVDVQPFSHLGRVKRRSW